MNHLLAIFMAVVAITVAVRIESRDLSMAAAALALVAGALFLWRGLRTRRSDHPFKTPLMIFELTVFGMLAVIGAILAIDGPGVVPVRPAEPMRARIVVEAIVVERLGANDADVRLALRNDGATPLLFVDIAVELVDCPSARTDDVECSRRVESEVRIAAALDAGAPGQFSHRVALPPVAPAEGRVLRRTVRVIGTNGFREVLPRAPVAEMAL